MQGNASPGAVHQAAGAKVLKALKVRQNHESVLIISRGFGVLGFWGQGYWGFQRQRWKEN